MKKSVGVVHAQALCLDCGVQFTNYKNAQGLAAQHAGVHKHKVNGELGMAFSYDGREAAGVTGKGKK